MLAAATKVSFSELSKVISSIKLNFIAILVELAIYFIATISVIY